MPVKPIGGQALSSRKRFPLVADPTGRFLRERDGTPWLLIGDSPQPLFVNASVSSAESYITTRISQGFNTFMVMIISDDYTFGQSNGTTYDGIKPFNTGTTPATYDLSTPNSTYWARMDQMVALGDKYDVCLMLDPIQTGGGAWLTCMSSNGNTKCYNYGAFLGARYAGYPNIIWEHGNDFATWSNVTNSTYVKNVMNGIADNCSHLQTIELMAAQGEAANSLDDTTTAAYVGVNGSYIYQPTYDGVLTAYADTPTTPCFLLEANYEGENVSTSEPGNAGPLVIRKQAYWTMTCGATGSFFGSYPAYRVATDGSWSSSMTSTCVTHFGTYHRQFFQAIPWWNLVPDTGNLVLTSGFGTYEASGNQTSITSDTYATCAADSTTTGAASLAVIYTPVNHGLVINMAKFRGTVTAQWYDPTNGSYSSIGTFAASGSHTFTPSATNSGGDPDWVLLLQA